MGRKGRKGRGGCRIEKFICGVVGWWRCDGPVACWRVLRGAYGRRGVG